MRIREPRSYSEQATTSTGNQRARTADSSRLTLQRPISMISTRTIRGMELISSDSRIVLKVPDQWQLFRPRQNHQAGFFVNDVQDRSISKWNDFGERAAKVGLHMGCIDAAKLSVHPASMSSGTTIPSTLPIPGEQPAIRLGLSRRYRKRDEN